jgi:hypothetical protein
VIGIGTDRWRSESLCARQGVPHGHTESGGIVLDVKCWAPSAQGRCYRTVLPDRALPTFSRLLIVKKTSLSLPPSLSLSTASLSLSLALPPSLPLSLSLSLPLSLSLSLSHSLTLTLSLSLSLSLSRENREERRGQERS